VNLLDLQNNGSSKLLVNSVLGYVLTSLNVVTTAAVSSALGFRATSAVATTLGYTSATNHSTANTFLIDMAAGTMTQTSGTNGGVYIHPTYNQASGSGTNTDLRINRTETAVMSGAQNFIEAQVAATTKFAVTNTGAVISGSTAPVASAQVEIVSTTKGFLPPRMTATQGSAISSPAEGLMIYVTDTNGTFTAKGWWGYDGSNWLKLNN
jgi:hypothetical protein